MPGEPSSPALAPSWHHHSFPCADTHSQGADKGANQQIRTIVNRGTISIHLRTQQELLKHLRNQRASTPAVSCSFTCSFTLTTPTLKLSLCFLFEICCRSVPHRTSFTSGLQCLILPLLRKRADSADRPSKRRSSSVSSLAFSRLAVSYSWVLPAYLARQHCHRDGSLRHSTPYQRPPSLVRSEHCTSM